MRIEKRRTGALFLLFAAVVAGCTGLSKRDGKDRIREAEEIDTFVRAVEREQGRELRVAERETTAVTPAVQTPEGKPVLSAVPPEEPLPPPEPPPREAASIEVAHVPGFRVQLLATRDAEKARSFAESVRKRFPEKIYVEYLEPYYKVRVGDSPTREEARALLRRAREAGFDEAWIAPTLISVTTGMRP